MNSSKLQVDWWKLFTFVEMKMWSLLLFVPMLFLMTACPTSNKQSLPSVFANKMDFPNLEKRSHAGIDFQLSALFKDAFENYFLLKPDGAYNKEIMDMNVRFCIETFTSIDAASMEFIQGEGKTPLESVHENYINRRLKSLEERLLSTRKPLSKKIGFNGFIQVIEGGSSIDDKLSTYMIATLEIDNQYHVIQLIGPKDHMGYFYDDFNTILESIEK